MSNAPTMESKSQAGRIPLVIYVFALSAFALGFTEFVTIGLVSDIAADLNVGVDRVGAAVAAYAIGATIGAPILTALAASWSRKHLLLAAMIVCCASYASARSPGKRARCATWAARA